MTKNLWSAGMPPVIHHTSEDFSECPPPEDSPEYLIPPDKESFDFDEELPNWLK